MEAETVETRIIALESRMKRLEGVALGPDSLLVQMQLKIQALHAWQKLIGAAAISSPWFARLWM
jgi:hypothetical protein